MRLHLLIGISAAVWLATLGACRSDSLGIGASAADLSSGDLRPAIGCAARGYGDCLAHPECVADTCSACGCTPSFVACRAPSDPPAVCPMLGCDQPQCCRTAQDCAPLTPGCVVPPTVGCFGPCVTGTSTCATDVDCHKPGEICEPNACSCVRHPFTTCTPGCTSDTDCDEPFACGSDGRCRPRACDSTCAGTYACSASGTCERKACTQDTDCGKPGYCVERRCSIHVGQCVPVL